MDFAQFSAAAAEYARENGISDYQLYYQADSSDQFSAFGEEIDRMSSAQVRRCQPLLSCQWENGRCFDGGVY